MNIFSNPTSLKLAFAQDHGMFHGKRCILGHPNAHIPHYLSTNIYIYIYIFYSIRIIDNIIIAFSVSVHFIYSRLIKIMAFRYWGSRVPQLLYTGSVALNNILTAGLGKMTLTSEPRVTRTWCIRVGPVLSLTTHTTHEPMLSFRFG